MAIRLWHSTRRPGVIATLLLSTVGIPAKPEHTGVFGFSTTTSAKYGGLNVGFDAWLLAHPKERKLTGQILHWAERDMPQPIVFDVSRHQYRPTSLSEMLRNPHVRMEFNSYQQFAEVLAIAHPLESQNPEAHGQLQQIERMAAQHSGYAVRGMTIVRYRKTDDVLFIDIYLSRSMLTDAANHIELALLVGQVFHEVSHSFDDYIQVIVSRQPLPASVPQLELAAEFYEILALESWLLDPKSRAAGKATLSEVKNVVLPFELEQQNHWRSETPLDAPVPMKPPSQKPVPATPPSPPARLQSFA